MSDAAMSKVYAQSLVHQTLPEFVQYARQRRCNLEVAGFAYANVYDADWGSIVQQHKHALGGFDGKISFHGVFQDVTIHSSDKQIVEVSRERILSNLDIARQLNAAQVVFHAGFNPLVKDDYYLKNWVERQATFWSEVLEKYQITVLIENTWEPTPDGLRRLLDQVNSPSLKICFDVAHAHVYSKKPLSEWFHVLGSEITYIHLSDNYGDRDEHSELGKGNIDWKQFTSLVNEQNVKPEVTFELVTLDRTEKSIQYMKDNAIYPF